jgi:hypothetical protein
MARINMNEVIIAKPTMVKLLTMNKLILAKIKIFKIIMETRP